MRIELSLGRHCIETEMKRQYNKAISAYFKAGPAEEKKALEDRIELLQGGLANFDFNRLRARHPELRGEVEAEVVLKGEPGAVSPCLEINGEAVHAD
jgi:hypothetical protein